MNAQGELFAEPRPPRRKAGRRYKRAHVHDAGEMPSPTGDAEVVMYRCDRCDETSPWLRSPRTVTARMSWPCPRCNGFASWRGAGEAAGVYVPGPLGWSTVDPGEEAI